MQHACTGQIPPCQSHIPATGQISHAGKTGVKPFSAFPTRQCQSEGKAFRLRTGGSKIAHIHGQSLPAQFIRREVAGAEVGILHEHVAGQRPRKLGRRKQRTVVPAPQQQPPAGTREMRVQQGQNIILTARNHLALSGAD